MTPTGTIPDTPRIHRVRRRLARWRETRAHQRAPIPAAVWAAAVGVAREYGVYQTACALPISYGALKAHVERATRLDSETPPPSFVELTPVPARHVSECVIEFDVPRGSIRLRVSGLALSDLVALARALGGRDA